MMRSMLFGCVVLLAVLGLVGCASDDGPRPTPSKTTLTPPPDVPIAGPVGSPITWLLERGVSATDPQVIVLQRYLAFDTYVTSLFEDKRFADSLVLGYRKLATGEQLQGVTQSAKASDRGGATTGPLWIRLSEVRSGASTATFIVCADSRQHRVVADPYKPGDLPFAERWSVRNVDGVWKVSFRDMATSAERARCRGWDISDHKAQ